MTRFMLICFAAVSLMISQTTDAADKLKLLIIDGQNNHNWKATTPILKQFLTETGRFEVSVATTPPKKAAPEAWEDFNPDFSQFDVVLSNYNSDEEWPMGVKMNLESYVEGGGGLVIIHAANNAFPNWPAWNRMIGLGWRNNNFGPRVHLDDEGNVVVVKKGEGPGASHGKQHEFAVRIRDTKHPITEGMPPEWMHVKDELYHGHSRLVI